MSTSAARWRPVGTILLERGEITEQQLAAALAEQQRSGRKLGEVLIESGAITWLALANAIAEQAKELDEPEPAPATPAPALPVRNGDEGVHTRLHDVEEMLKERQRAFLELVGTTETLRRTVERLQDELTAKNEELLRLRSATVRA